MNIKKKYDIRGKLLYGELMSRHTSWRVGGPAEIFFSPESIEDLSDFLKELDVSIPIFWHGIGSNILVRDGGLLGVVISAAKILRSIERLSGHKIIVGSGFPCTQLAKQCIRWELGPSEFFAGISDKLVVTSQYHFDSILKELNFSSLDGSMEVILIDDAKHQAL